MRGALAKFFGIAALSFLAACQTMPVAASSADLPVAAVSFADVPDAPVDVPLKIAASIAMPQGASARDATPAAYAAFCARAPEQCVEPEGQPDSIAVVDWSLLAKINAQFNHTIKPMSDADHYGVAEYWTIPTDGLGDCEDIALAKRQALAAAGMPIRALRMATVVTRQNLRHAVLTVTTEDGDYVLDNLNPAILPWTRSGYIWLTRQDPARGWVAINAMPEMNTASTGTATIR